MVNVVSKPDVIVDSVGDVVINVDSFGDAVLDSVNVVAVGDRCAVVVEDDGSCAVDVEVVVVAAVVVVVFVVVVVVVNNWLLVLDLFLKVLTLLVVDVAVVNVGKSVVLSCGKDGDIVVDFDDGNDDNVDDDDDDTVDNFVCSFGLTVVFSISLNKC